MRFIQLLIVFLFLFSNTHARQYAGNDLIIAKGQMPNMVKDKNNTIHIVYGSGDSIMYIYSKDGRTFSTPALIAVLPQLFSTATRGAQIASSEKGIIVTACTQKGNIYSYRKGPSGKWTKGARVNEVEAIAKEGLMGLSADGLNTYAVWLGVKKPKGQNVYGALSTNGGNTWKKNVLVYASPDSTVCECCKPSVVVKGNKVYVMFRNWLQGNRDLYITTSGTKGMSFEQAQKLGTGNWKLNGCPMDGGGLTVDEDGIIKTVWRREGKIYTATPGKPEVEIGEGRSCTLETVKGKNIYAWTDKGEVIVMEGHGIKKDIGKGSLPLVKALNNDHILCVWEAENQIHASLLKL